MTDGLQEVIILANEELPPLTIAMCGWSLQLTLIQHDLFLWKSALIAVCGLWQ